MPESLKGILSKLLLVVIMLVRPQGLFGTREIWDMGPFKRRKTTPAPGANAGGSR